VDGVVAWDGAGRRSGVFVNTSRRPQVLNVGALDKDLLASTELLRVDLETGDRIAREPFDGTVRLGGYGVAVVTNAATELEAD
jgi:hypothetical protein